MVVPRTIDVQKVRGDFPALHQEIHGKKLVYLDNAATTQKPSSVIKAISDFYTHDCSNVHRGVHALSERATKLYEDARDVVSKFLNAGSRKEIIFLRGTTEAINLVASTYAKTKIEPGDELILTGMEHHSNIVPWYMLSLDRRATLKVVPMDDSGTLMLDEYEKVFSSKTKMVLLTHVSNALGTVNPVKEMIRIAHKNGVPVLIDGAQAAPHLRIDVQDLDCDFYAFSSHKAYGPTGIGVLYGKRELLEKMPPYQGGGDMISSVTFEEVTYAPLPYKFEAGTPSIADAVGLSAAIKYIWELGHEEISKHESELLFFATERIGSISGIRLVGTAKEKVGVLSFILEGIHPHDVGTLLDQQGIAIRTGQHCAQPIMDRFGITATCRASMAVYNTVDEIEQLACGIEKVKEVFS